MASATRETPKATRPARRLSNRTTTNVKIEDVGLLRMVSLATLIAWWHENAATASKCCVSNMPKHQCRESPQTGVSAYKMLHDIRMAGLVKLHRSTGRTNERQQWAESAYSSSTASLNCSAFTSIYR